MQFAVKPQNLSSTPKFTFSHQHSKHAFLSVLHYVNMCKVKFRVNCQNSFLISKLVIDHQHLLCKHVRSKIWGRSSNFMFDDDGDENGRNCYWSIGNCCSILFGDVEWFRVDCNIFVIFVFGDEDKLVFPRPTRVQEAVTVKVTEVRQHHVVEYK